MEIEYFIRKTLLLLDAGSRVQRYFIERNETKLQEKSICAFLRAHTEDVQTSLKSQKHNLMTKDFQEWDFSLLSSAINLMAASVKFDESQERFLSFLKGHRDMLQYSELLEVRKSAFQSFSKCFDTGLNAFSKDFDMDFIFDIRALISEINSANIERLEKNYLVRNELFNIWLKEHLSTDDAERKSEIQQSIRELLENRVGHITVDLQWLPNEENEQEDVQKWFLHTNHGSNSESFNVLMQLLTSFGVKDYKGTTSMCVVLNCQPTQLLSLLQFLDGSEFGKVLKDISLEISKDSGKEIELSLDAMKVVLPESRHETDTYDSVGDENPVRLEADRRQGRVSEKFWISLRSALQMCRAEEDLWEKFGDDFSKISTEIEKEKETPEIIKIIVICENYSGAHSFMNFQLGQDILPPSPAYITRVKHRKNLSGVMIETTHEASSASFVNRALSRFFAVDEFNRGIEKMEEVVVVWPFKTPILPDDVEWIFVPETDADCDITEMLEGANGLLYIANAGSSDCLREEMIRKVSSLDWKFPVFILNRWNHLQYNCNFDFGEPRASELAYSKIIQRLKMFFPNMNEMQALRFRMTEVTDEASQKMKALSLLEHLIVNSRCNDSAKRIRWIRTKVSLIRERVQEMKTEGTKVLINIGEEKIKLRRTTQVKQREIKEEIEVRIRRISTRVVSHVKSQRVREEMANWSFDDFPCSLVMDSKEKVQRDVQKVISNRLGRILERDMKSDLEQYRNDMLGMLRVEIDGITQQFKEAHQIIVGGSFAVCLGASLGIGLATFVSFAVAIEQTLTAVVLWGTFFSLGFFALGLLLLPVMFIAALLASFSGNPISTPHTMILKEASKKVIDGFNEKQIQEQFEAQIKEVTNMVDRFFMESVPAELVRLDEAEDKLRKTLKRYDEIIEMLDQTRDMD